MTHAIKTSSEKHRESFSRADEAAKNYASFWFINNYRFHDACARYIYFAVVYQSRDRHRTLPGIHAHPSHGTVNHISNNVWFTLTVHDPNLSCCRAGGRWNRMAGVDPRVAWEVHGLPESSAYMSRCRPRRRPRPTVYASTGSHSPETIDGTQLIAMTFKNRESDLIWRISVCRHPSAFECKTLCPSASKNQS